MKTETAQHTPTCIRWQGAHDTDGYGRVMSGGKWRPARSMGPDEMANAFIAELNKTENARRQAEGLR